MKDPDPDPGFVTGVFFLAVIAAVAVVVGVPVVIAMVRILK